MRMLSLTLTRADGVEIGASCEVDDVEIDTLLAWLVDITGATTAVSGTNPDAPVVEPEPEAPDTP